ncbi:acyltransferase [Bacillus cereus]|nr:acyltransferase [Bacillus cereus]
MHRTNVYYRFFILGCGGTGGYVAQHIAQMRKMMSPSSSIFLIDPDIVEDKVRP